MKAQIAATHFFAIIAYRISLGVPEIFGCLGIVCIALLAFLAGLAGDALAIFTCVTSLHLGLAKHGFYGLEQLAFCAFFCSQCFIATFLCYMFTIRH